MTLLKPFYTGDALELVGQERSRQDDKWGIQDHDMPTWLAILTEEVGELATAVLQQRFKGSEDYDKDTRGQLALREEAIQVAAVAVAIVESLDRARDKERVVGGASWNLK